MSAPRVVAFYLPQFHPIPENDEWWGAGFTEWFNVVTARPLYGDHDQPKLPADLGFYDLRTEETRMAQADLAREYGVDAFCYYHYWFGGRRLLSRPFDDVLRTGRPRLSFCLCWANENWTRRWNGDERGVLMRQRYSKEDDEAHIRHLVPALRDPRYLRVDGRPVLTVYRTSHLPDASQTAARWRRIAAEEGIADLFLCKVEGFREEEGDPRHRGFDASIDFTPNRHVLRARRSSRIVRYARRTVGFDAGARYLRFEYRDVVREALSRPAAPYPRIPCVFPAWDNTARRGRGATIVGGSTPDLYRQWLEHALEVTPVLPGGDRLVFVNAWNEWAEGAFLEPSRRWGRQYLEAHRAATSSGERT